MADQQSPLMAGHTSSPKGTTFPKSVVIVGGGIAGLMHGIYLKRHGVDVVLLEQDPQQGVRRSNNAGIGFAPGLEEFLRDYDLTKIRNCTPAARTRIAWRKRKHFKELAVERHTSSWGLVFAILRANFDGLPSEPIPGPPAPLEGDGRVDYRPGKKVTGLRDEKDGVRVSYVDVTTGVEDSAAAELVLGADGFNSTVRTLLHAPTLREYSGYVSWRGIVKESEISEEAVKYFTQRSALNLLKRNYIVTYIIPSESGSFVPGERVLNFLWYWPAPEGSQLLQDLMTDTNGKVHRNTVPPGLVRREVWSAHLAANLDAVAEPFAEVISKCGKDLFVTKVNDVLVERAVFHDGRVLLVGDALVAMRPHVALATDTAAAQVLGLGRVWKGETTLREWEAEAVFSAKRRWLVSRVVGIFGVCGWWEFLKVLGAYVAFVIRGKKGSKL